MSVVTQKKNFLNLYMLYGEIPCQLYCIGFCISQVKLRISGSHIFKDIVTRHPKYVVIVSLQAVLLLKNVWYNLNQ